MYNDYVDRRKHERVNVARAIYLEVVSYGSRSEADNLIYRCETIDVSKGGLCLLVPQHIPPGRTVNIAAPLGEGKESVELVGESIWSRPTDSGDGHWVGLQLQTDGSQDMDRWVWIVQRLKRSENQTSA